MALSDDRHTCTSAGDDGDETLDTEECTSVGEARDGVARGWHGYGEVCVCVVRRRGGDTDGAESWLGPNTSRLLSK